MVHPIMGGVHSLRRRWTRRTCATGLLLTLALAVAIAILLGAIDFAVRIADPGVRVMLTFVLWAVSLGALWQWLIRPLRGAPSDVAIARHVMQQDQRFGEELPAAVEFLKQSEEDPLAGSVALRRAVIIDATVRAADVSWTKYVDRRPLRWALALALAAVLLVGGLAISNPQIVAAGATRLAAPLGNTSWPRAHDLHFLKAPQRLASGETFEVELVDRGERLPDDVWIHYRFLRDGQQTEHREPMQRYGDVMVARREMVIQPFEYRAIGGDDDRMAWRRLELVEPPRLRSLELTLYPPAYSGLRPMASDRHIRTLPGTRIELAGHVSHPIVRAQLTSEHGHVVPVTILGDGTTIRVPAERWSAEESVHWSLRLEDHEGLIGGQSDRISVHVSPDPPPSVTIAEPAADQFVTANAVLPIGVAVKDNLAVRSVALTYLRSDQTDQDRQRIELFEGSPEPPANSASSLALVEGDRRSIEHRWDLAKLGLSPGTFLAVHAEATDYHGEVGQTPLPRNIYVVSLTELETRLAEQQEILVGELERALRLEREARAELGEIQIQLAQIGSLQQRDVDSLQAVEINQRHITDLLTNREEGILGRIDGLRADLKANRIEIPEIHRRLDELDREIFRLSSDHLPMVQRELVSALKTAAADPAQTDRLAPSLSTAADHQDEVIRTLSSLLGDFSRWSDYRRFSREVAQLRVEQERVTQMTREVSSLDASQPEPVRTGPQARAEREKIMQRQLELARRLETLQQQMEHSSQELQEEDPLASTTLADAVEASRRHAIDRRMREAAQYVDRNQTGRASDAQGQIDESLREVLGILRNTRESELRRLVSKLREAEQDLAAVRGELDGLQSKLDQAEAAPSEEDSRRQLERLLRDEEGLREQVERMSRRLMRLTADQAGRLAARAAGRLGGAGQSGSEGNRASRKEQLRGAQQDLEQAQSELAEVRRRIEADLAQQQLADMGTTLGSLADRQQQVAQEAQQLESHRVDVGEWTFGQLQSLAGLAGEQELIHAETLDVAERLAGLTVVKIALQSAAKEMQEAQMRLQQRDPGPRTQELAELAHSRLRMVISALGESSSDQPQGNAADGAGGNAGGGQDASGGPQHTIQLAEIRLLKLMQQDVKDRTSVAEMRMASQGSDDRQAVQRYNQLATEQGELATLILQLLNEQQQGHHENEGGDLPSLEDALQDFDPLPDLDL